MGIELNTEQLYTVMDMESWYRSQTKQVYEISGAAGTGKTTLVMYLIQQLGLTLDEVLFVAYMGKAATQLARNGLPATTIPSAIYIYRVFRQNCRIIFYIIRCIIHRKAVPVSVGMKSYVQAFPLNP